MRVIGNDHIGWSAKYRANRNWVWADRRDLAVFGCCWRSQLLLVTLRDPASGQRFQRIGRWRSRLLKRRSGRTFVKFSRALTAIK
jgi:hypothetical protein